MARYGGEEFCVVFPDMNQWDAVIIAEKIRKSIEDYQFFGKVHMPSGNITVSIGVSELLGVKDYCSDLINRADTALYRAKFFMRNRVEIFSTQYNPITQLNNYLNSKSSDQKRAIKILTAIFNSRDRFTYNHFERLAYFSEYFANYLGLTNDEKKILIYSAYLHDLGKLTISGEVIATENYSSKDEWEDFKKHPIYTSEIIRQINGMENVAHIVSQVHERFDGSGYPKNLQGTSIHRLARILTVIDYFDSLTNNRPYQEKMNNDEAYLVLKENIGTHFDPELTVKFIKAIIQMYANKQLLLKY